MTNLPTINIAVATSLGVFRLDNRNRDDYVALLQLLRAAKPVEFEHDGADYCIPAHQVVYLSGQQTRTQDR